MLKRLHIPLPCDSHTDCSNTAYWRFNGVVLCHTHVCDMADGNTGHAIELYEAIVSPGVVDRMDRAILHIYPETILSALCAVLNTLPVSRQVEIVHHHADKDELIEGSGLFVVESVYASSHTPIIQCIEETGEYDHVAERVNQYAERMRKHVASEYDPGQEANR